MKWVKALRSFACEFTVSIVDAMSQNVMYIPEGYSCSIISTAIFTEIYLNEFIKPCKSLIIS